MPHRNGHWVHRWVVNYKHNHEDIESTLEYFVDEEAAWQFYQLMKDQYSGVFFGELYTLVPKEKDAKDSL